MESMEQAAVLNAMNKTMSMESVGAMSVHDMLAQASGHAIEKELAIAGDGVTSLDCFVVTGSVKVLELWLDITAVVDSTDFEDVQFDLFPTGGAAIDITDVVNGDACAVGDQFIKTDAKTVALTYIDIALGGVTEGVAGPPPQVGLFTHFVASKKTGAVTNIRLTFNGDGSTDITGTVHARYYKLSVDGALAVAA